MTDWTHSVVETENRLCELAVNFDRDAKTPLKFAVKVPGRVAVGTNRDGSRFATVGGTDITLPLLLDSLPRAQVEGAHVLPCVYSTPLPSRYAKLPD